METDGFVDLASVLNCPITKRVRVTVVDIVDVVDVSRRPRFEILKGRTRALQAHSLKVVDDDVVHFRPLASDADRPPVVLRGACRRHRGSVLEHGLLAGGFTGTGNRVDVNTSVTPGPLARARGRRGHRYGELGWGARGRY